MGAPLLLGFLPPLPSFSQPMSFSPIPTSLYFFIIFSDVFAPF
jgi:hypothetical protein